MCITLVFFNQFGWNLFRLSMPFDNTVWQRHLTMPFDNAIWQCHLTMPFDNAIWQRHLTTPFDNAIWQRHSKTPFDNAVWQHHLTMQFDNAVWQCRFTMLFDSAIWQRRLTCYLTTPFDNGVWPQSRTHTLKIFKINLNKINLIPPVFIMLVGCLLEKFVISQKLGRLIIWGSMLCKFWGLRLVIELWY